MSQETIEFHYAKHHQAYVVALNRLTEGQGLDGKSLETIVAEAGQAGADGLSVLNQAGQHWNHVLFWRSMSPGGGGDKLPAVLEKKLNQDFGSFDKFKEEFTNAGMRQFGSG